MGRARKRISKLRECREGERSKKRRWRASKKK